MIKNAAINPEQNINEIKDFIRVFKALSDKGYEIPNDQISKENFRTRIITKIKHFFSKIQRDKLLREIDQATVRVSPNIIAPKNLHIHQEITQPEKKNGTGDH